MSRQSKSAFILQMHSTLQILEAHDFINISLFHISLFVFVGLDLALRPIHRGIFLYFVTLKDENARVRLAIAYWALSSLLIVCKYG